MATIKDIADAAGVSIGTVDRIIHNRGRFSAETADKVRGIMEDLNYSPNIHARGLKKTRQYTFAAVVPNVEQEAGYWRLAVEGIEQAAEELTPFSVKIDILQFDRYSAGSAEACLLKVRANKPDGLLVAPVVPDVFRKLLAGIEVPYLFIDTDIPDVDDRISFIGQDSYAGGVLSAKLMLMMAGRETGGGKILIIEPPGRNFHINSRIEGFRKSMNENSRGLKTDILKIKSTDEAGFHSELGAYLSENEKPAGIYAANSSVYFVGAFLQRAGNELKDIPLIGYDLIPERKELIENGFINFILTQQPALQAYQGITALYDALVLRRKIRNEIIEPLNIITKENLHTFSGTLGGIAE